MEKQKNQNPLELMAQLESIVVSVEVASKNQNLFSKAVKPYLMKIYFPEVYRGDEI